MKFLFLTDCHIKGINPGKRKDIYYLAILRKLSEIKEVIQRESIAFVVIGGDLFDQPKISNILLGDIATIIRSWKVKVFVVPGNHDLYGHNLDTIQHTSLGILQRTGVVTLLTRDISPLYIGKKNDPNFPMIAFTGQEYHAAIDRGVHDDYKIVKTPSDFHVLAVHGMLLEKPFLKEVPHTLMSDTLTEADLVLSGHYHPDSVDKTLGSTHFVKPRSVARLEATKHNVDHLPQYVIIEVTKANNVTSHTVKMCDFKTAEQGNVIFDYKGQLEEKLYKNELESFKNAIQQMDLSQTVNLSDMLKKIAGSIEDIQYEHIEKAIGYLVESEKTQAETFFKDFIPSLNDQHIESVHIKNFQSHKDTFITFSEEKLNALVGESNNGKTSIIRALVWCLYNEPKGANYIRHGEKSVTVTIAFSNGHKLTRKRTLSDTGYYEIENQAGEKKRYTKFGTNIPIEIYNLTQMPKIQIAKNLASLNVSSQLEGPFMLSVSASERAQILGKITKTDVVDQAINDVSKKIIHLQKAIKSQEADISKFKAQLKQYDKLEHMAQCIKKVEALTKKIKEIEKSKEIVESLRILYDSVISECENVTTVLDKQPNLKQISKLIQTLETRHQHSRMLTAQKEQYAKVIEEIATNENLIDKMHDTGLIEKVLIRLNERKNTAETYKALEERYTVNRDRLDKGQVWLQNLQLIDAKQIEELKTRCNALEEAQTKLNQCNAYLENREHCIQQIEAEKRKIEAYELEIAENEADYKKLLKDTGTCPLCGNDLTHTHNKL